MWRCKKGVDFLSVRMVVVITAAAILMVAASSYIGNVVAVEQASHARDGVVRFAGLCRMEYALSASKGDSGILTSFDVPRCVRRIVFGCSPGEASRGDGFDRYRGAYFIEYVDGSIEIYVTDVNFAYGDIETGTALDIPVCIYPGRANLDVRIMPVNGTHMAVIFGGLPCRMNGE